MDKVTIQNIAEKTDLSRNTVARALNDNSNVSEQTKKLVLNMAMQMGYKRIKPEMVEKYSLSADPEKIKTVLVFILSDKSLFWTKIIEGVNGLLQSKGYYVNYYFVAAGEDYDLNAHICPAIDIVGVIALSVFPDSIMHSFERLDVPVVCLDIAPNKNYSDVSCDIVLYEGVNTVAQITKGLIDQGLNRIGFIGDTSYSRTIKDRFDGYVEAIRSSGRGFDESIIFSEHVPRRYYDKAEIEEVVTLIKDLPDAIVCANDTIARLLIDALTAKKFRVPEDIAVTGYDDIETLMEIPPFITTVHVEHEKLGQRIASQILWRIENPSFPPEVIALQGRVVTRGSSRKFNN